MDKAMELLEQLAIKLGVTIEYLWETLIRQQHVEGITNIVMAIVEIIVIAALLWCIPRVINFLNNKVKELEKDRRENGTGWCGSYHTSNCTEDFYKFLSKTFPIVGIIVVIIIFVCLVLNIKYGIQQLLNPDYFALKEVLDAISSSIQ